MFYLFVGSIHKENTMQSSGTLVSVQITGGVTIATYIRKEPNGNQTYTNQKDSSLTSTGPSWTAKSDYIDQVCEKLGF